MFVILAGFMLCLTACTEPAVPRQKVVDEGGLGKYPAIVTEDAQFKGYTIYRPADMVKAAAEKPLPLVVFGNGGCANTSVFFERFFRKLENSSTMSAASSFDVDLAEAIGALLGGRSFLNRRLFAKAHQFVDSFNKDKDDKSHQQEVDDRSNKVAEVDRSYIQRLCCFGKVYLTGFGIGEILTGDQCNDPCNTGHDNIVTERTDDRVERSADDHTDCKIHDVSAHDELFEFFHELTHSFVHLP